MGKPAPVEVYSSRVHEHSHPQRHSARTLMVQCSWPIGLFKLPYARKGWGMVPVHPLLGARTRAPSFRGEFPRNLPWVVLGFWERSPNKSTGSWPQLPNDDFTWLLQVSFEPVFLLGVLPALTGSVQEVKQDRTAQHVANIMPACAKLSDSGDASSDHFQVAPEAIWM